MSTTDPQIAASMLALATVTEEHYIALALDALAHVTTGYLTAEEQAWTEEAGARLTLARDSLRARWAEANAERARLAGVEVLP